MVFSLLFRLSAYLSIPADILSFSESPFITDLIKIRQGLSIYSPMTDNNSYPYPPGTQYLLYAISSVFQKSDSIPFLRLIQFSFVFLAALTATWVAHLLGRKILTEDERRPWGLWLGSWLFFFFLLSFEPKFNIYNHSLHNDGLALLITLTAYGLILKYALHPKPWVVIAMAILPTLGFWVKQSLLIWLFLFGFFLAGMKFTQRDSFLNWKHIFGMLVGGLLLFGTTVAIAYISWGPDYTYWVFSALGEKSVSLARSIEHLFQAGIYAAMGLTAAWVLILPANNSKTAILWLVWATLFSIEVFTSGLGFVMNHLGPGIMIASAWFFIMMVKIWPRKSIATWRLGFQKIAAGASLVLLFGGLGFIQQPRNPIPKDLYRYITDIEAQFTDLPVDKVLLDAGSWIYLKEDYIGEDRSTTVSLHVGINQPSINIEALQETIERIEQKQYARILARQIDTPHTWYDFGDRGSGIKQSILQNYHIVDRIPAVQGINQWWPMHLIGEVVILEPNT